VARKPASRKRKTINTEDVMRLAISRVGSRMILGRSSMIATITILITALPATLFAWGDDGHEIIGVIAYSRLAPAAKRRVDQLLKDDKDPLTAGDFVSRTTWADKFRDSDRNSTRLRYNATRNWHFVDIEVADGDLAAACANHPKLPAGMPASAGPEKACAVDKIDQFAAELRNASLAKAEQLLALKFLLHLIGDLHQPLHAADRKDRGGNDVAVLFGDRSVPDNLHAYWDTYLVQKLGDDVRAVAVALNLKIGKATAQDWAKGTATDWARDSFRRAKSVVYNFAAESTVTNTHGVQIQRLNTAYESRALPTVREQLSKAGVRLAMVLNNLFK